MGAEVSLTAQFGDNCATHALSAVEYMRGVHGEYCRVPVPPAPETCSVVGVRECLYNLGSAGGIASAAGDICG